MIDVGFWEMAFIGVIALVIIGPERMPGVVRTAGAWFARARRMVNDVKRDFRREMDQADMQSVKNLQREIRSTAEDFRRVADDADVREATGHVNRTMDEMKKDLGGVETLNTPPDSSAGPKAVGKPGGQRSAKRTAGKKAASRKKKTVGGNAPGKKQSTTATRSTGTGRKKKTSDQDPTSGKMAAKRRSATAGSARKTRPARLTKKTAARNTSRATGTKQDLSGA